MRGRGEPRARARKDREAESQITYNRVAPEVPIPLLRARSVLTPSGHKINRDR